MNHHWLRYCFETSHGLKPSPKTMVTRSFTPYGVTGPRWSSETVFTVNEMSTMAVDIAVCYQISGINVSLCAWQTTHCLQTWGWINFHIKTYDYQTCHLIGWQRGAQPIRSHVWKSLSTNFGLIWISFRYYGPDADCSNLQHPIFAKWHNHISFPQNNSPCAGLTVWAWFMVRIASSADVWLGKWDDKCRGVFRYFDSLKQALREPLSFTWS